MFEKFDSTTMLKIKKFGYLLVLIAPAVQILSWYFARSRPELSTFWAFFPLVFVFGIVPLADYLVGKDPSNPDENDEVPALNEERIYRWFTIAMLPVYLAFIAFAGWAFAAPTGMSGFNTLGQIGWLLSTGVMGGIIAINVGHELIHKEPRIENWAGGLLYASVTYATFKVEHVRGHHVHVSTPEDASSSRFNQSLYSFVPQAVVRNFIAGWRLQKEYLARKGKSAFSLENELIWWYACSFAFAACFYAAFGWIGVAFFFAQGFIAGLTLEIINYIEHYGLHRRKLENGRYESVTPAHSWNSNYLLTNLFLFQLQRHSDHHAYARRRYQVLRHYDDSPQLPAGYATMFVLAFFPPLWKRIMNPRVERYYKGEMDQLFRKPAARRVAALPAAGR